MQKDSKAVLHDYWGFPNFRGSQEGIIQNVLNGKDVLALLPTGGGKSLCYQIPALAQEGICIVVSPLVSLIQDQTSKLKSLGIKAIALTGGVRPEEVDVLLDNCIYGAYKFLYLSPERLQQRMVQERIKQMPVNLLAIDEAHCISQWGHDFRPAYLKCHLLRELQPEVPLIALTATATEKVMGDIVEHLRLDRPQVTKDSFFRKNIGFKIYRAENQRQQLLRLVKKCSGSSIIYCDTRRKTVELAHFLNEKGIAAHYFHGGLTMMEKKERLGEWLNHKPKVMVATNAFGMGVDNPNVRLVVHLHLPESISNYYQEAGRAGRDGGEAEAWLLLTNDAVSSTKKRYLGNLPDITFIKLLYAKLNAHFQVAYGEGNDTTHMFHFKAFCDQYGFPTTKTHNGLRILEQHGVLAMTHNFGQEASILLITKGNALFTYLDADKKRSHMVKTLLRTYGGVFEYETKINTNLIAKKAGVTEKELLETLERLHRDGVALFNKGIYDLQITFLVPREDERTINSFGPSIAEHHKRKVANLDQMIAYGMNQKKCRAQFLVGHYGERLSAPCGKCDICLKNTKVAKADISALKSTIMTILGKQALTSKELFELAPLQQDDVLLALRELLEDEKITLNTKSEYEIN